ncbi:GMC family oxidoreductase [Actinocorallia sp. A-T 12471]|uniref:GMC family oxidoreductase n=1 Tax=Actinocorallia sp. A-T 12471 TaxID=3089813 RepID=UPI0029CF864A|nr:GMC family oxidoreductase [Actinocorallia sp. A-T 12471]MDX6742832.1 GMC family oxidoreductase [Actinocorallia sp. A-T 12471]
MEPGIETAATDFDVLVIGSGFGGAVAALRLSEKGYRVGVLEAGRRRARTALPATSWRLRDYLWMPGVGLHGIQRAGILRGDRSGRMLVLGGAGHGGGSLVSANVFQRPSDGFFTAPQWAHITDWKSELEPYFDQASRMFGVMENPTTTAADLLLRQTAAETGASETFRRAPVGVFFNDPAGVQVPDPYFGGTGPARSGCIECGECMTGCRHGAKNTLPENYLHLAERAGAVMHTSCEAVAVRPEASGGFLVDCVRPGVTRSGRRTFRAAHVVLAAGTEGTQRLLHRMKAAKILPKLSDTLGTFSRASATDFLSLTGEEGKQVNRGVAITSSIHPDPGTRLEPVRYGSGSNLAGLLRAPLADAPYTDGMGARWRQALKHAVKNPAETLRLMDERRWSDRSIILMATRTRAAVFTVFQDRGLTGHRLRFKEPRSGTADRPRTRRTARAMARRMHAKAAGSLGDLLGLWTTAYFQGGCPIGVSRITGVIDPYHRVHGYPNLHVVDASSLTADPGVPPSLTITAQAERAMALWPNKGDQDPRPLQADPYTRLPAIPPLTPTVPQSARGALLLPLPTHHQPPQDPWP